MKKARHYGLKVFVPILLVLILSLLTLTACNDKTAIQSMEIVTESVPDVAVVGEFDVSQINLNVTLEDGTVQKIAAAPSMLTAESKAALKTAGQKNITLFYQNQTVIVSVFLVEAGTETVSVTFLDAEGAQIAKKYAIKDGMVTAPTPPAVEGKVFSGWVISSTGNPVSFDKISSSIVVYAAYSTSAATYTVDFVDYKGNKISSATVPYGSKVTPPAWEKPSELSSFSWGVDFSTYTVNNNVTFRMTYEYASKTVTYWYCYSTNMGTKYALLTADGKHFSESVKINSTPSKLENAKTLLLNQSGATLVFERWMTYPTTISADTDIIAVVEPRQYTISYMNNMHATANYTVGESLVLPTSATAKEGYTFNNEWYDTVSKKNYKGTVVVSADMNLEPVYVKKNVNVNFTITFSGLETGLGSGIDYSEEMLLSDCKFEDVIDIDYVKTYVLNVLKKTSERKADIANYQVDEIVYVKSESDKENITTSSVSLTVKEGGAAHEFEIMAVDSTRATVGLSFVLSDDTLSYKVSAYNGTSVNVFIPEKYNNKNVTVIMANVFNGKTVNVSIPETVTEIGANCFENAVLLADITLPALSTIGTACFKGAQARANSEIYIKFKANSTLTDIPASCFENTVGIVSVELPSTVVALKESAFKNSDLKTINLDAVTTLENDVFMSCDKLSTLGNVDEITAVGDSAFDGVSKINALSLPKLKSLGTAAFMNMTALTDLSLGTATVFVESETAFTFYADSILGSYAITKLTLGKAIDKLIFNDAFGNGIGENHFIITDIFLSENFAEYSFEGTATTGDKRIAFFSYVKNYVVNSANAKYASKDGVLYVLDEENYSLDKYPINRTGDFVIPESVNGKNVVKVNFLNATVNNLTLNGKITMTEIPNCNFEFLEIKSITVPVALLGEDIAVSVNDLIDVFGDTTLIYINGAIENFATLVTDNGWTNVIIYDKTKGYYSLYDSTSCLVYTIVTDAVDSSIKTVKVLSGDIFASEIIIPEKIAGFAVTEIAVGAFSGYVYLEKLTINAKLNGFADDILDGCIELADITIADFVEGAEISTTAFNDTAWYNNHNVIGLGGRLIVYNNAAMGEDEDGHPIALTTATKDDFVNIKYIPDNFFKDKNLTAITIGDSVTQIGKNAFENSLITKFDFNNIVEISDYAFKGSALESAVLVNVVKMGTGVFESCEDLVSINIPNAVNAGAVPVKAFMGCSSLVDVIMNEMTSFKIDVDTGSSDAFSGCSSLESADFLVKFAEVPANTFAFCYALKSVDFTKTAVAEIGDNAFYYCASLTHVTLSATVKRLGSGAFSDCNELVSVSVIGNGGILEATENWETGIFPVTCHIYLNPQADKSSLINYDAQILRTYPTIRFAMMDGYSVSNSNLNIDNINNSVYVEKAPEIPVFDGYTFDGWYLEKVGNIYERVTFPLSVSEDVTLYAKYFSDIKGSLIDSDVVLVEGGWKISSFTDVNTDRLFIPATYTMMIGGQPKNYPIVEINASAFSTCVNVTEIIIPEGVKIINQTGANGFNAALKKISLPASLVTISGLIFNETTDLEISFAADSELLNASLATFNGTKWYTDVKAKAASGLYGGFVIAGRLALEFVLNTAKIAEIPTEVIKINDEVFRANTIIKEIRLNDNIRYFGVDCFKGATNLEFVNYTSGNAADSDLKELNISAFSGTKWLSTQNMVIVGTILAKYYDKNGEKVVVIPDYITKINEDAFANATMETLQFGTSAKVEDIGARAFAGSTLISVVLPASVKVLGDDVFSNCVKLATADFSATGLTYLPRNTFNGCIKLNSFTANIGIEEFKEGAFSNCVALRTIVADGLSITDDFISAVGCGIEDSAWYNTAAVETAQFLIIGKVLVKYIAGTVVEDDEVVVTIPEGVLVILERAFDSATMEKVIVPASVQYIEASAFINCSSLVTVELVGNGNLKEIGESAFSNCIKLKNIVLPDKLEIIGDAAFAGTAITSLVIPDSVIALRDGAFNGCTLLETVKLGSGIEELGKNVFKNCVSLYKVEWTLGTTQLNDISSYIAARITDETTYTTTLYNNYIESLFSRDSVGKAIRLYMNKDGYNSIANYNDGSETARQFQAWDGRTSFGLYLAGNYPTVSFETGEGYFMATFQTEVIESLGTPAKTGNTFVGWYTDSEKTIPLVLPYRVYTDIQLYAKWYSNDIGITEDVNLEFGLRNNYYYVSTVNNSAEEIYIPASVDGKAVTDISLLTTVPSVKRIVLTNSSNFNGMAQNIFRFFPNLEEVVLLNSDATETMFVIKDGAIFNKDYSHLIAYIGIWEQADASSAPVRITEYSIPNTVTEIYDYAFVNSGLTTLTISKNVYKIGYKAFNDSLTNIVFETGLNITDADSTSFDNTVWYESVGAKTDYIVGNSTVGHFYSAGNMLLEYKEIAVANELVIPDVLKNIRITVLASYLNSNGRVDDNVGQMTFSSMTLPTYLTTINLNALKKIDITTNITARDALVNIADNVFDDTDFYIQNNSEMLILGKVLVKCVNTASSIVIPSNVVAIANNAFNSSQLVNITLPAGLTSIGDKAFYACSKLLEITIPDTVTYIGENAFTNNSSLRTVIFNTDKSKLTKIMNSAFSNCSSLTSIALPYGVLEIGDEVFLNCKKLATITFDHIVKTIDKETNLEISTIQNLSKLEKLGEGAFNNCEALSTISIPNGVTIINSETFYNCKALTKINFDIDKSALKEIGTKAFYGCVKLGSEISMENPSLITVVLPNKLQIVRENAFENCSGMYGIQLNYNIKTIEGYVFYGCASLAKVVIYSATPATIASTSFLRETVTVTPYYKLRIYISDRGAGNVKKLYQRTWTNYSLQIFALEELPKLTYIRNVVGSGGMTETYMSDEISVDVVINPTYVWNSTTYATWNFTAFKTISLDAESFEPVLNGVTGEIVLDVSTTDRRLNKELGSDAYQKFTRNGIVYTLFVVDYDYVSLTVR